MKTRNVTVIVLVDGVEITRQENPAVEAWAIPYVAQAVCAQVDEPDYETIPLDRAAAEDHAAERGRLCKDDGKGCCEICGVAMVACDDCGGVGYHAAGCPVQGAVT